MPLTEELLTKLFGSHVRVEWLRWMANNVDKRIPVSYLRGRRSQTRTSWYRPFLVSLRDVGMVSNDPGYHWVVEPHPAWDLLRPLLATHSSVTS